MGFIVIRMIIIHLCYIRSQIMYQEFKLTISQKYATLQRIIFYFASLGYASKVDETHLYCGMVRSVIHFRIGIGLCSLHNVCMTYYENNSYRGVEVDKVEMINFCYTKIQAGSVSLRKCY